MLFCILPYGSARYHKPGIIRAYCTLPAGKMKTCRVGRKPVNSAICLQTSTPYTSHNTPIINSNTQHLLALGILLTSSSSLNINTDFDKTIY